MPVKTRKSHSLESARKRAAKLGAHLVLLSAGVCIAAIATVTAAPVAFAQQSVATIRGTAKDASGAVIPQATVTATSVDTGVSRSTQTGSQGEYSLASLQPGTYNVTISHAGFQTSQQTGVKLDVGSQLDLNLVLNVGSAEQTVTVEITPGEIPSSDATLGTVMEQKQVVDLPLNGRQFSQLIQLEPGVVPIDNSQASSKTPNFGAGASNPSVNGQSNRSNIYFIDGAIDSDPYFGGFSFSPSVDVIQEFKAESHTDQAEFGLATGAIVNVVTRPGTNQLHGSVFEFNRNTIFNTQIRNFSSTPQPKLPYHLNQFGGSIGGPIFRNHLFFFANYEGGRQSQANPVFYTVPTAAERAGNFSGTLPGGMSPTIYDPATYNPATHTVQPFAGNIIPANRINAGMLAFLNAIAPLPNTANPSTTNNLYTTLSNQITSDQGSIRLDYNLGEKDNINGRYSRGNALVSLPQGAIETFQTGFNGQNLGGNWTHTYNSSTISQLTLAYNTLLIPQEYVLAGVNQSQLFDTAGLGAGFSKNPGGITTDVIPGIGFPGGNYSGITAGAGPVGPENIFEVAASLSKSIATHFLKVGGSFFNTTVFTNYSNNNFDFSYKATWNASCQFNTMATAACPTYNANAGDLGAGGDPVASMLLSLPVDATRSVGFSGINMQERITSLFAQDTWSPTSRLTLTYGLRWDYNAPVTEANGRMSTYNPATQNLEIVQGNVDLPAAGLPPHVVVVSRHSNTVPHYLYFQPRLGVAYQFTEKTVFRAGIGRTYNQWALPSITASLSRGNWPSGYSQQASTQQVNTFGTTLKPDGTPITGQSPFYGNPTLPTSPFPLGGAAFEDTNWQPASSFQWNAEVQQDFGLPGTFKLAYVGSQTEHAFLNLPYDIAAPSTNPTKVYPDQVFGAPGYEHTSRATASYHALQTQLSKSFSNGLVYNASFTWSKGLGIGNCGSDFYNVCIQNPYNIAADKGRIALDVPLIFTFNAAYELPFGKGKAFITSGPSSHILGGWQVNSIIAARSGTVINPTNGQNSDQANVGGGSQRVNFAGDPNNKAPHTINAWFNPTAFQLPAFGTYGNAGLNSLRGPGYWNVDFSLFKNVPIHERLALQLRAEAFDLFNHPNLSNPQSSFAGTTTSSNGAVAYNNGFNIITSTLANSNRVIQLAAKINF